MSIAPRAGFGHGAASGSGRGQHKTVEMTNPDLGDVPPEALRADAREQSQRHLVVVSAISVIAGIVIAILALRLLS
jgi:hypothetical protein